MIVNLLCSIPQYPDLMPSVELDQHLELDVEQRLVVYMHPGKTNRRYDM